MLKNGCQLKKYKKCAQRAQHEQKKRAREPKGYKKNENERKWLQPGCPRGFVGGGGCTCGLGVLETFSEESDDSTEVEPHFAKTRVGAAP